MARRPISWRVIRFSEQAGPTLSLVVARQDDLFDTSDPGFAQLFSRVSQLMLDVNFTGRPQISNLFGYPPSNSGAPMIQQFQ